LPIHYEIQQPNFKLVLWQITEPLTFFESKLQNWEDEYSLIKVEDRKLQYAASRYVASLITNNFTASQIIKNEYRQPFLINSDLKISISHDENWAVVAIGNQQVGVDVFCVTKKVLRIADRFMNATEKGYLSTKIKNEADRIEYYSLLWSIKETVFKWMQLQKVEFRTDIILIELSSQKAIIKTVLQTNIEVQIKIEPNFILTWIE
jgi:4'-phosphopantetheinyl transferase